MTATSVPIYAEPADLQGWLGEVPADAAQKLFEASLLVGKATRFDVYTVDENRMPTDPRIRLAFREATCQQVATWKQAKVAAMVGLVGQAPQVASQSVDGGSVSYTNLPSAAEVARASTELGAAALLILQSNGLASRTPGLL